MNVSIPGSCSWVFSPNFFLTIALLDDLDKELNNYIMRCREWYGWHFPELGKTVTDNLAYCKCVQKLGKFFFLGNILPVKNLDD